MPYCRRQHKTVLSEDTKGEESLSPRVEFSGEETNIVQKVVEQKLTPRIRELSLWQGELEQQRGKRG